MSSAIPGRSFIPTKTAYDAATDRAKGEIAVAMEKLAKIYPGGFTGTLTIQLNFSGSCDRCRIEISDKPAPPNEQFDSNPTDGSNALATALANLRTRLAYDLEAKEYWGNVTLQMTVQRGMVIISRVEGQRSLLK